MCAHCFIFMKNYNSANNKEGKTYPKDRFNTQNNKR